MPVGIVGRIRWHCQ